MRRLAGLLAFPLLVLRPPAGEAADLWYVSNRLGMKVDAIARYRADEFPYVLRERRQGEETVLTLYHRGESTRDGEAPLGAAEVTRWERRPAGQGAVEESVYERGALDRITLVGPDGRVREETVYREGNPVEVLTFFYGQGLLRAVEAKPPGESTVLWRVDYQLTPSGELRAARRSGLGAETAAFGRAAGRLQEEYLSGAGHTVILRYDGEGRRVVWEVYRGRELARATYDTFDPSTGTRTASRDLVGQADRAERAFDPAGNVVEEVLYRGEKTLATTRFSYDAQGRRARAERTSESGVETWTYRYGPTGELEAEEYRERGAVRQRTVYTGADTRYEEIVQSDRSSLRVYYREDRKIREEFLRDGRVIRTRDLAEGS